MKSYINGAALALCVTLSSVAFADDSMPNMSGMDMSAHQHHHDMSSFGHPASAGQAGRKIAITMNDLSFSPAAVTVKAGETVLFVVHNTSAADHDFTLGDKATQEAHRKEMAEAMNGQEEMEHHHHHGGNALTVKAGKTAKLAWTFDKPGVVEYDCNVPGHYEAGMAGTVTVTP
jgi:uncharacterized cupredoxin-like copper-binding protein